MNQHTILLIQTNADPRSRTFEHFERISESVEHVIKIYEIRLRELNPHVPNISYDVSDLHKYIDALPELGTLVLDPKSFSYVPHDKEWMKHKVLNHLSKIVSQRAVKR